MTAILLAANAAWIGLVIALVTYRFRHLVHRA
jgi:hypothetical protein